MARTVRILGIIFCCLVTASCSSVPTAGPSTNDVINQGGSSSARQYEFIPIDPFVVYVLRQQKASSFQAHFSDYRPSLEPRIGVGDTVSVTIWEASAGGLFSAPLVTDKFSTGSNSATIPDQVVGRDGSITIPFAGRVHVAGHTARTVQMTIERALSQKAIQPQALVNVTHAISASVTVLGEVTSGARVPLSIRGDRITDVIAEAGGIRAPINETYVQLSRGFTTVRVPLTRVTSDARENIYMRPNDVLTLIRDPQTFIAYGATGKNAEIPFDAEGINLAQALAKAGGLLDYRSDAAGVFVVRFEPPTLVRILRPRSPMIQPRGLIPVIYQLDLHNPASLFAAQAFPVRNRDLIFVSNAPMSDLQKIIGIVGGSMSPALSAAGVAASACVATGC